MHIPDPTEQNLITIVDLLSRFGEGRGEERYVELAFTLQSLTEVERWMLSFLCFMSSSAMFPSISRDPYLMFEPTKVNQSSFMDFVILLKALRAKKYDKELIQFMLSCSEGCQEFYWLCLEQPWVVKSASKLEVVRDVIAEHDIVTEELLGDFTFIHEGWLNVTFPLVLTAVPSTALNTATIHRIAFSGFVQIREYVPRMYRKPKVEHIPYYWLTDKKQIHTQEFVLVGKIDRKGGKFYPYDYFQTAAEYALWRRKGKGKPYHERIDDLNHFLRTNYVRQIQRVPLVFTATSHNMEVKISQLLRLAEHDKVMACDGKLRTYCLETTEQEGVIGDIWTDVGEVKGFIVWHQAHKVHVGYDFPGNDEALLFHPKEVIGKHCRFNYFEYSGYKVGGLREILWDKPVYKPLPTRFTDGEEGYIERCPVCLKQTKHFSQGCCEGTMKNLVYHYAKWGSDTWWDVMPQIKLRRKELGWTPEFLNRCDVRYKGHRLIAGEDGRLMFQSDEHYQLEYQHWWNICGNKFTHYSRVSREELIERFNRYKLDQMERNRHARAAKEAGSLCEVPELYQQDVVAVD